MKGFSKAAAIRDRIESATALINEEKAAQEKLKLGMCRAGSTGAVSKDGKNYYADCGRKAQARYLGFERSPTSSLLTMFEGGLALENRIEKALAATDTGAEPSFSKEQSVQGKVGLTKVSGRPDFDIVVEKELVGLEVKSMASPFSAIKQVKNAYPLIKHLVQACTYMILLERDCWVVVVGNVFFARERAFSVNPELRYYQVNRNGNEFSVCNEKGQEVKLEFGVEDIERYYAMLVSETNAKRLMPRPTENEINVDSYDRCKYCPMSSACNEIENGQIDFDEWMRRVPLQVE